MRALWSGELVDDNGEFHHLQGAQQQPVPFERFPIVSDGTGPATRGSRSRRRSRW